ncbi:MAG: glycosyltransferase family 9 protein [Dehalococcoidia bacterium]
MRGRGFPDPSTPLAGARRILLARLDNIGDVILLSPAVNGLRQALPEAELTLLTSPAGAAGAVLLPAIDRVVAHRASWQQLNPGSVSPDTERELIDRLRTEDFDAAIVFTSFAQSALPPAYLCYLAGIPTRAAYASRGFSGEVITHPVDPTDAPEHQAERAAHLLESLGIEVSDDALSIELPVSASEEAARLLRAAGIGDGPFVALVPGASAPARRYRHARFARVARRLAESMPVLVLGDDREAAMAGELEADAGALSVVSLAGRTSLPLMAALVQRARLVVGNNSLALHLADALRTPVVATYAGTDPHAYWTPRDTPCRLLTAAAPCAPCFRIECDRGHECLDLAPEDVVRAAIDLLEPAAAGPPERGSW